MKYYNLTMDGNVVCDNEIIVRIKSEELTFGVYDTNLGNKLPEKTLFGEIDNESEDYVPDYINNNLDFFLITPKFKRLLEQFQIGETQFIPLKIKRKDKECIDAYLVNIVNHVDALNLKESRYTRQFWFEKFKLKKDIYIIDYALNEVAINNQDLFCLKNEKFPQIFISENLKKTMVKEKIEGCNYYDVKVIK